MDDVQDTVDIPTAAGRMGITPEAVRKRIARGTLPATKQDGRWYVVLDGQDGQGPASWTGRPTPDGIDSVQDAVQDDKDKLIEQKSQHLRGHISGSKFGCYRPASSVPKRCRCRKWP